MLKRLLFLSFIFYSSYSYAFDWQTLWYNKFHQGVNYYRAQKYDKAIEKFSKYDDAQSHYNRGNALAHSKKYKEAIKAYDKALERNPNLPDAKYNREIVKKILEKKPPEEQRQNDKSKKNKKQDKQKNKDKNQQNKEKDDQQKNDQQSKPDQKQKNKDQSNQDTNKKQSKQEEKQQQDKQQKKDKQDQQKKDQRQKQKNEQDQAKKSEQEEKQKQQKQKAKAQKKPIKHSPKRNQADQQMLNKVPDDPGGLLRRKFQRDYERRQMEIDKW